MWRRGDDSDHGPAERRGIELPSFRQRSVTTLALDQKQLPPMARQVRIGSRVTPLAII
jgi:hypothetical protein